MYTPNGRVYDLDSRGAGRSGLVRPRSLGSQLDRSASGAGGRSTTLRTEPPREPLVKYTPPTMKSLRSNTLSGRANQLRSLDSARGSKGRGDAANLQKSLSDLGLGTAVSKDGKRPAIVLYDPPRTGSPQKKVNADPSFGGDDGRSFWSDPDGPPLHGGDDDDDGGGFDGYGDPPRTHYDDDWNHHHHDRHGWYWWNRHCYDYDRACYGWYDWCFSYRYYGGYGSRFWFGFSFGFGGYSDCFYRPWCYYGLDYWNCYVSYHRPWSHWYRAYCRPYYRTVYYYQPWYRRAYYYDDYYYDDYWYEEPAIDWYGSYQTSEPVFLVLDGNEYQPALPSVDTGWSLLTEGALDGAIDVFSELIYALPTEGEARIGYALAVGLQGRDAAAMSAMRQALRDDPEALFDVPRDEQLRARIEVLLDHYSSLVRKDFRDVDALFMTAALRFMLDEHATAYFAVDAAIRNGDTDPSSENLKRLLDRIMSELF